MRKVDGNKEGVHAQTVSFTDAAVSLATDSMSAPYMCVSERQCGRDVRR